jgi:hypothetical protein
MIPASEAARLAGLSERYFRRLQARSGNRFAAERIQARDARGRVCYKVLVAKVRVKKLTQSREAKKAPLDRMSLREAAKRLRVSKTHIYRMVNEGTVYLDGARLDCVDGHVPRPQVEEIRRRMERAGDEPVELDGMRWLPERLAVKKYPNAGFMTVRRYRNKPCPQMGGRILHARTVVLPFAKKNRGRAPWCYLEDDLKSMTPPRRGWVHVPLTKMAGDANNRPGDGRGLLQIGNKEPMGTENHPPKVRKRLGRIRSKETEEVYKYCYDERAKGRKRSTILRETQTRFGSRAPKTEAEVRTYAKRYAERNGLSLD